jgi:hypothetical protein
MCPSVASAGTGTTTISWPSISRTSTFSYTATVTTEQGVTSSSAYITIVKTGRITAGYYLGAVVTQTITGPSEAQFCPIYRSYRPYTSNTLNFAP